MSSPLLTPARSPAIPVFFLLLSWVENGYCILRHSNIVSAKYSFATTTRAWGRWPAVSLTNTLRKFSDEWEELLRTKNLLFALYRTSVSLLLFWDEIVGFTPLWELLKRFFASKSRKHLVKTHERGNLALMPKHSRVLAPPQNDKITGLCGAWNTILRAVTIISVGTLSLKLLVHNHWFSRAHIHRPLHELMVTSLTLAVKQLHTTKTLKVQTG